MKYVDPHGTSLEDKNIFCYYPLNLPLLNACVDRTSLQGGTLMSKRLSGYDYSQPGFYFITICTQQHRLVFGTIVNDQVYLKGPGQIAQSVWNTLPSRFAHVNLHEYVFMPNHMHAIIELTDLGAIHPAPKAALWEIVRVFKAVTAYTIRRSEGKPWFAWQEDYYDEIIRTEAALQQIRQYILDNPARWSQDKLYKRY
jgi:putative transposase